VGDLKIFFSRTTEPKELIYIEAFLYNVNSRFFKSWSPGVGRGHNKVKPYLHEFILRKIFFSKTSRPISIKLFWYKLSLGHGNSTLFKLRASSSSNGG
jgi:hypothetical protein